MLLNNQKDLLILLLWKIQNIALIVAVTLLVTTCIIGVMTHNLPIRDHEWKPYVFPMHRQQVFIGK
jgi:hypothetical protein